MPLFKNQLYPRRHSQSMLPRAPRTPPRRAVRSPEAFKAELLAEGKTIRQWAEENGFPPSAAYRVLNGVDKSNFGRAHDIAVKAGIKSAEVHQLAA